MGRISNEWWLVQKMIDPNIDFTKLNIDDLIPHVYSDWTLDSAKHIQVENTDDFPKIDSRILEKSILDEYSLDDFDWNQFSSFYEQVDSIIKHESNLIDKIFLDEF